MCCIYALKFICVSQRDVKIKYIKRHGYISIFLSHVFAVISINQIRLQIQFKSIVGSSERSQ